MTTDTLDRLLDIEERAIRAGVDLDLDRKALEGRRRIGLAATWLILARDDATDSIERRAVNAAGQNLRAALRALDRAGHQ